MSGTRERIIAATHELFRVHGYNGTTLSLISEAAEAPIGSIYHFFPGGKEALTIAVIDETGVGYRDLLELIVGHFDDVAKGFADYFRGAADLLRHSDYLDPCPIGTVAREAASTSDAIREASHRAFESWVDAAAMQLRAGGVDEPTARDLATVFVSCLEGGFILSRAQQSPEPLRAAARVLIPLIRTSTE